MNTNTTKEPVECCGCGKQHDKSERRWIPSETQPEDFRKSVCPSCDAESMLNLEQEWPTQKQRRDAFLKTIGREDLV
jgi:hypothetical protein